MGIFFVYLLDPIYLYFLQLTKNRQISSFLTIALASCAILGLIYFVADSMLSEISNLIRPSGTLNGTVYLQGSNLNQIISSFAKSIFPASLVSLFDGIPADAISSIGLTLKDSLSTFIAHTPLYITQLILLVFFTFCFFTDGKDSIIKFLEITPKKNITHHFLGELNLIYNVFFRVQFFIALVSAVIAMMGFFFIGLLDTGLFDI